LGQISLRASFPRLLQRHAGWLAIRATRNASGILAVRSSLRLRGLRGADAVHPLRHELFYVGQLGAAARDPKDVLIRADGEALFSRRCVSEDEARYVANGMKQDELKTGSIET